MAIIFNLFTSILSTLRDGFASTPHIFSYFFITEPLPYYSKGRIKKRLLTSYLGIYATCGGGNPGTVLMFNILIIFQA